MTTPFTCKISLLEDPHPYPNGEGPCSGLYFRGKINEYVDESGFYRRDERLVKLKRKSCKGCEGCVGLLDEFSTSLESGSLEVPKIEHGKLYELKVAWTSTDWESGAVDDWGLGYFLVKEGGKIE